MWTACEGAGSKHAATSPRLCTVTSGLGLPTLPESVASADPGVATPTSKPDAPFLHPPESGKAWRTPSAPPHWGAPWSLVHQMETLGHCAQSLTRGFKSPTLHKGDRPQRDQSPLHPGKSLSLLRASTC